MNRNGLIFLFLIFSAAILFIAEISLGSVAIPIRDVFHVLLNGSHDQESWKVIVLDFRLPRAIAALLSGAFLAVSGLLMQTLFRNPLAGPHILGISSGASLGVALVVLGMNGVGLTLGFLTQDLLVVIAAFIGSISVLLLLFAISLRIRDILTVLIFGILISAISLAIVGILQYLSAESQLKAFLIWTLGSFDGVDRMESTIMALIGIPLLLAVITVLKPLNLLLAGEDYAVSLGLNLKRSRFMIMLFTGGLTSIVTAYCGPIGFVGVVVPHFCRLIFKTFDHRILYMSSILMGVNVVLISDLLAHLPGSDMVLPVNSITSLIGIPFLFWILLRKKVVASV